MIWQLAPRGGRALTILSAYAPANVNASSKDARAPILRREAEKHKRYASRLAHIGPGTQAPRLWN